MATHSSILAWRIPWTKELDGLQSMGVTKSKTQLSNYEQQAHNVEEKRGLMTVVFIICQPRYKLLCIHHLVLLATIILFQVEIFVLVLQVGKLKVRRINSLPMVTQLENSPEPGFKPMTI